MDSLCDKICPASGLVERLQNGETILIAEGYMWEIERRGFLQFGNFLPEVVIERPEAIRQLHEEFALAGSDVVEAFTYYCHREKLRLSGREEDLERINRTALKIAREVADKYGLLMAGNLSNTPMYKPDDPENDRKILEMFKEQVVWAVEGGADYIVGETFNCYGEALLALEAIKQYGNGLPAVITLTAYFPDHTTDNIPIVDACRRLQDAGAAVLGLPAVITLTAYFPDHTTDNIPIVDACRRLQDAGAAVVGLNCARGFNQMLPLVKEIKKACTVPIAANPVPYRTTEQEKTFLSLTDKQSGIWAYPDNLDCVRCSRVEVRQFALDAKEAGIQYIGLCCGNYPALTREVAEALGRNPPASKYRTDTSQSFVFGENAEQYGEEMANLRKFMIGK